jgi:hypothetical protein
MNRILRRSGAQELLQWFGLLGAPLAWTVQLVVGYGVTEARCDPGSSRWGVGHDTWQVLLMVAAGAVVIAAEAASVLVYAATREVSYSDAPPLGRRHFFATASALVNVLFLAMILMSGLAAVDHELCRQS